MADDLAIIKYGIALYVNRSVVACFFLFWVQINFTVIIKKEAKKDRQSLSKEAIGTSKCAKHEFLGYKSRYQR